MSIFHTSSFAPGEFDRRIERFDKDRSRLPAEHEDFIVFGCVVGGALVHGGGFVPDEGPALDVPA